MKLRHEGWLIEIQPNVHMYCHKLTASKGDLRVEIPCEDTPEGFVGIWPYDVGIDDSDYDDLVRALHLWAASLDSHYRLYVTRDRYETEADR